MKRARAQSATRARKRTALPVFPLLALPPELRGEVRTWLDVRARYRLHLACRVTYEEEPQGVFDFPLSWRAAIHYGRPIPDDPDVSREGWLTNGDLARSVWFLGWHRWPGLASDADGPDFYEAPSFYAGMDSAGIRCRWKHGRYFVVIAWNPTSGVVANARVPMPVECVAAADHWAPDGVINLRDEFAHAACVRMVADLFSSMALKYVETAATDADA